MPVVALLGCVTLGDPTGGVGSCRHALGGRHHGGSRALSLQRPRAGAVIGMSGGCGVRGVTAEAREQAVLLLGHDGRWG